MNFYGVGVKYGRVDDKLPDFQKYGFWCMDFESKEDYEMIISNIRVGDVVFAKAYTPESPKNLYIRAIGFVTSKKLPEQIPGKYQNKHGFSVNWTTRFEDSLILIPCETFMPDGFMKGVGNLRTRTIFHETNDEMILKIVHEMSGPF